jgi:4-diphosphocytidyl-2-C-methyl-D-erythritol kinase
VRLRALAPGKVNLCLFLGPGRDDGRHEVVTLLESVSLADEVSLAVLAGSAADEVVCVGVDGPNLVSDALAGLRARGWDGPPVRIQIIKRLPVAAGMGGGSADAAAALRLAAELAPARPEAVAVLAAALGADVPSQLVPGLWLGTGAGDQVEPLVPLAEHAYLILPQPFALSTADVYREADRLGFSRSAADLREADTQLRARLRAGGVLPEHLIVNDLEPATLSLCPAVSRSLDEVRGAGADQAFVSGSGPTVAGLFWGPNASERAAAARETLLRQCPEAAVAVPVGGDFGLPRIA